MWDARGWPLSDQVHMHANIGIQICLSRFYKINLRFNLCYLLSCLCPFHAKWYKGYNNKNVSKWDFGFDSIQNDIKGVTAKTSSYETLASKMALQSIFLFLYANVNIPGENEYSRFAGYFSLQVFFTAHARICNFAFLCAFFKNWIFGFSILLLCYPVLSYIN